MAHRTLHRWSLPSLLFGAIAGCGLLASTPVPMRAAADATIAATWRDGEVTVDGSMADWERLQRVDDGPAVAVQNDDTTLYVAVATNDVTVREQLATGLIVWIDATGRKRQTFGLRLEGLAPRPIAGATSNTSAGDLPDQVLNRLESFDLLGPARLQRRLIDNAADVGIALASGVADGMIVYELKLPLAKTDATPQAVGVRPGATISLGLETPADPRPARQRNRLDDPTNTNPWVVNPYGGYFTQPPPPPGGSPRAPREVVIRPMKLLWVHVRLATPPA